jgi:uncharacterized LabA/DUF88 family protein
MTQATPNTQDQNQSKNSPEGRPGEQANKPARSHRPRRSTASARSATSAKRAPSATEAAVPAPEQTGRAEAPAPRPTEQTSVPAPEPGPAREQPQHQAPQPAAQQPARPRRTRRAVQPAATAASAAPATTAPAHAPAPQAQNGQQPAATAAPTEAEEPAAVQPKKRASRGGRGHRGGRKNEVQLIKPAEIAGEQPLAPAPEAGEVRVPESVSAVSAAEMEPRMVPVVPVVTHAEPLAEAETETVPPAPAAEAAPPLAPAPEAAPAAPSRFRFGRRTAGLPPEQPVSPAPAPERETERAAAPVTPPAPPTPAAPTVVEAPEEAEEEWQATVAEVAPEALPEAIESRAAEAIDDLVAALGLQGAAAPGAAPAAAEPTGGAAEIEAEAEEERQATRRRRRRRKSTSAETAAEPLATPQWAAEREQRNGYERAAEPSRPYSPYNRPSRERLAPVTPVALPEESPFVSPEPQMVRGFGPQPQGVAEPAPSSPPHRPPRERERLEVPPMSPNQLGNMLTHAIQQQTDRLLSELHRQPQGPAMTLAVPLPSTERVGIFVDVANLIYSARNQRVTLDFGRILDFLRGNRRLIRAHAYAPTNPEPGADQSFLNAVRGLGYRITTKNFKTFASGAKKADMDLDLCMDIVRMVDAGSLDTIVLVSGDSDFLPLLEYASDHGVRVEVAAFEDAAAAILRQSCDLFINLSLVEGIAK